MNFGDLNRKLISKLTSQQVEHVTCLECCKYYKAAATSVCGHTLCRSCWIGRNSCPYCKSAVDRRELKQNILLQTLTDHVCKLGGAFEKMFDMKLDDISLEDNNMESEESANKNVKQWLTSSQNHFSAPVTNSQDSPHLVNVELSDSKIQIHTNLTKPSSPTAVVHVNQPQDDWDKIEVLPDTEEIVPREKENVIGPMDLEPFMFDENEYSTDNPRRSLRKRDKNEPVSKDLDVNSKTSNAGSEKKSNKAPQTWSNVKKMRKEFSKLNQKNRSKLNVSIEMCKKTQKSRTIEKTPVLSQPPTYTIDDNTPNVNVANEQPNNDKDTQNEIKLSDKVSEPKSSKKNESHKQQDNKGITNTELDMDIDYDEIKQVHKASESSNKEVCAVEKSPAKTNYDNIESSQTKHKFKTVMPIFKKSALYVKPHTPNAPLQQVTNVVAEPNLETDDIEISIKIGNTVTNIVINKKKNDVQLKVNTDREIQTSLGTQCLRSNQKSASTSTANDLKNLEVNICGKSIAQTQVTGQTVVPKTTKVNNNVVKSNSTKKNTASAETATAQFEITESVEREISDLMECVENESKTTKSNVDKPKRDERTKLVLPQDETDKINDIPQDVEFNDDIFASGSVKDQPVQMLSSSDAHSEIFTSKNRTQKHKRHREVSEIDVSTQANKKHKAGNEKTTQELRELTKNDTIQDSEGMNYDAVMGKVFASIDKDIEFIKSQHTLKNTQNFKKTQTMKDSNKPTKLKDSETPSVISQTQKTSKSIKASKRKVDDKIVNEKYSENIFTMLDKDTEPQECSGKKGNNKQIPGSNTQKHIDKLLTPGVYNNLESMSHDIEANKDVNEANDDVIEANDDAIDSDEVMVVATPVMDNDEDVVEETPQKIIPSRKDSKQKSDLVIPPNIPQRLSSTNTQSRKTQSVINLVDSTVNDETANARDNKMLETPFNKFFDHITHKSTPMARKSLNFNNGDTEDFERTLCPTIIATQEKKFLEKALESQNVSMISKGREVQYCLAGSCLQSGGAAKVKALCSQNKWKYVDKYTKELTHLIVGVDKENRSQRSVKYMCALAASKWIVSIEWVNACLLNKRVVDESPYEVLDMTGEPGPKRSRLAKEKVFKGITFYCMPPFSVVGVEDLKEMIQSAGGTVVSDIKLVKATSKPALLLAEPEHTQEDRFTYLAMAQKIVPVNFEWVLNSLGDYQLRTILDLLLCPAALLPAVVSEWPAALTAKDYDSMAE